MNPNPDLKAAAKLLGALGGAAGTGKAKRRTTTFNSALGRSAAIARWKKAKPKPKH